MPKSVDSYFDKEIGVLAEIEAQKINPAFVLSTLLAPHPLVVITKRALDDAVPEATGSRIGIIAPRKNKKHSCLLISASKESVPRAICVMNALLEAFDKRGYRSVQSEGKSDRKLLWEAHGERFYLMIKEPVKRTLHLPNYDEKEKIRRNPHFHNVPTYDYVLSGKLRLELHHEGDLSPVCTISDCDRYRIEDRLDRILIGILKRVDDCRRRASEEKIEAEKQAELERKRQVAEEKRKQQEEQNRQEQACVDELFWQAEQWHRCQQVTAFINAAEAMVTSRDIVISPNGELANWISWARNVVSDHTPIKIDDENKGLALGSRIPRSETDRRSPTRE